jgi:uncharacterized protein
MTRGDQTRCFPAPPRIGVISDTHGLLRPGAVAAFQQVDAIIHAGDVGGPEVITELGNQAPVVAVRGNTDWGEWAQELPKTETIQIGPLLIHVLHDLHSLDLDPAAAQVDVVIHGHSHQPSVDMKNGILYLNPGGAGHRRFNYPVTVAVLTQTSTGPAAEILNIPLE